MGCSRGTPICETQNLTARCRKQELGGASKPGLKPEGSSRVEPVHVATRALFLALHSPWLQQQLSVQADVQYG